MNDSDDTHGPAGQGDAAPAIVPPARGPDRITDDVPPELSAVLASVTDLDADAPAAPAASSAGGATAGDPADQPSADHGDGDGPEDPCARRRRRRYYVGGIALALLIAIFAACAFIPLPYYRFAPGNLYSTQPLISVTGAQTYADPGAIDFTTVASKKVTVLEAGLAKFDPAVDLIDAELIDGDRAPEETRQLNLEMMADSKQTAEVVAARELGYPVEVHGTGAVVKGVAKRVEGILHPNDTIVGIDTTKISTADEAVAALQTHKPGDTITLAIEGPPDLKTGQAPPPRTETAVLAAREKEPDRPQLGVDLGTRSPSFSLPFTVDIDSKAVGGPSAGLAFTLGIIDVLTPGSLTGGKHVAVTGSMDLSGHVGEIGGIQQKTFLAKRQGADLFIVPRGELADAMKYAGDLKVVGVDDIDQALQALKDSGGETDVVQQAAAGRTGTTVAR